MSISWPSLALGHQTSAKVVVFSEIRIMYSLARIGMEDGRTPYSLSKYRASGPPLCSKCLGALQANLPPLAMRVLRRDDDRCT
jgi:hypothetical protein